MKILFEITKYKEEVVKIALGDFGTSLLNFAKNLNFNHPGIVEIPISNVVSEKLLQILNLIEYGFEKNLSDAIVGISKFYKKNVPFELENIDKKFVRLIKDEQIRHSLRNNKKICDISLLKFYEKANVIWDNIPNDFSIYSRYSDKHKDLIVDAESKANRYKQLGCDELYNDMVGAIEDVKELMNDTYHGYHRISLRTAALVLSKINGFNLNKDQINNKFNYKLLFGKSIYKPKLYPIEYLNDIFTEKVKETLAYLENIPMFDYYMVLVPSVENSNNEKDIQDIKNNNLIPILIGEKDGKCYFISYWT